MVYTCTYKSKLGDILLAADKIGLTGLWFTGQKYYANTLLDEHISQETQILAEAKKWLDIYFFGKEPTFTPPLHPAGSDFRQAVWQIFIEDSLWTDHNLRGDCQTACCQTGNFLYVCAGRRRRCGAQ